MTHDPEPVDVVAGMAWATIAPALAGGAMGLAAGPGFAIMVFALADAIAGAHVLLLALPLHSLLRRFAGPIRPGTAIIAGTLVGAMPVTLWLGVGGAFFGGLFGFIGSCAFCAVGYRGWIGGGN